MRLGDANSSSAMEVVRRRWPDVFHVVCSAPTPAAIARVVNGDHETLAVDGIHVTSCYDREAEADLQARAVPADSTRACIYGLALGDLARSLLRRSAIAHLQVVLLNPGLARVALELFDGSDWLVDPRVVLELGSTHDQVQRPFAVAPACLRLASEACFGIRDRLLLEMALPYQRRAWDSADVLSAERFATNRDLRLRDGAISSLFGTHPGCTAFVLGGGPSLSEGWQWLREHRRQGLLITTSTSLGVLQREGILADVAIAIDHRDALVKHFDGLDPARHATVALAYAADVHRAALEAWPGRRVTFHFDLPRYRALEQDIPKGFLFCSGSVIHSAVDLAVRMGARNVVLFGADFCYPGAQTHVAGAPYAGSTQSGDSMRFKVVNRRGHQVPSDLNFIGYLRDLEGYIAAHARVRFFQASEESAVIRGARPLAAWTP